MVNGNNLTKKERLFKAGRFDEIDTLEEQEKATTKEEKIEERKASKLERLAVGRAKLQERRQKRLFSALQKFGKKRAKLPRGLKPKSRSKAELVLLRRLARQEGAQLPKIPSPQDSFLGARDVFFTRQTPEEQVQARSKRGSILDQPSMFFK